MQYFVSDGNMALFDAYLHPTWAYPARIVSRITLEAIG